MSEDTRKEVFSWIKTIGLAVVLAIFINKAVIVNATIPTQSMENTINVNDRVIAFRWSYFNHEPERGDIVIFKFPDDENDLFVKRIIGLPGEQLEVIGGKVYIDGSDISLGDDFIKQEPAGFEDHMDAGIFIIPEDSYFMMGDNRRQSHDSRSWENSFVHREKILGKVVFKYFPNIQLMNNQPMFH